MAKFRYPSKLTKKERDELILDFCYVISALSDVEKAAQLVKDLLSPQEAEMLAKRVKIAKLLIEGSDYDQIQKSLKVSHGTIARVSEWLKYSGDGYRFVAKRLNKIEKERKEIKKTKDPLSPSTEWRRIKRRFPLYFWPQLIIEEIVEGASKRQKQRLLSVLQEMEVKPRMYKEVEEMLLGAEEKKKGRNS